MLVNFTYGVGRRDQPRWGRGPSLTWGILLKVSARARFELFSTIVKVEEVENAVGSKKNGCGKDVRVDELLRISQMVWKGPLRVGDSFWWSGASLSNGSNEGDNLREKCFFPRLYAIEKW